MIIAIDGPAAAGKGTLARRLAEALDFAYLDTGLLYRAVAARAIAEGVAANEAAIVAIAQRLSPGDLERDDLRREETTTLASVVAAIAAVRAALHDFQRRFAAAPPQGKAGAVLDGRDIGTVICPEAPLKLFVTADAETRARRRHKELQERGEARIYARVLQEMRERDARDSERAAAPLRPADDAVILDTTDMSPDAVLQAALDLVGERRGARL